MTLLIAVLLTVAAYFGWQQVQALRGGSGLKTDDRRFVLGQARRRLICCGLMVVIAGMLVGWLFLDGHYRDLHSRAQAVPEEQRDQVLKEEDKDFARFMVGYWIVVFLMVFALL